VRKDLNVRKKNGYVRKEKSGCKKRRRKLRQQQLPKQLQLRKKG
jgi:hypothetical protein